MKTIKFNKVELTEETILKTREHFYDICMNCIEEAKSGRYEVNDLDRYIKTKEDSAKDYINGNCDYILSFIQRAYYLQTGESIPLGL